MIRRLSRPLLRWSLPLAAMTLVACDSSTTSPTDTGVTSVSIANSSNEVAVGATMQLTASVLPATAEQTVTWSSSNIARATVSGNGLVTGVTPGEVSITATSTADPSRSGSVQLTVVGCAVLAATDVASGATLPADTCYSANSALSVNSGTLSIGPGVRIEFATNAYLTIASGGSMNATGTAEKPIVFTSASPTGSWRGIHFNGSQSASNVLRYILIENGGSTGWSGAAYSRAALQLSGNTNLDMRNSIIRGSGGQGINVYDGVQLTFENNALHDNAVAAWVHPNTAGFLGATTFERNTDNVVRVSFGNTDRVSTGQTWRALEVPYELQERTFVDAPLTVEAGATIAARNNVSLIVQDGGSLRAVGTAASPIMFTGAENLPGHWQGVRIATASNNNILDHVVFENGGSTAWTGQPDSRAMVYLDGNSKAVISRSTFRGSGHYALWVPAGADITGFSNNLFENNARAMIVHPNRAGSIMTNNTFTNNTENKVRVSFGNTDAVGTAQTWNDFGAPFYVTVRTFVEAPLSVAAGTNIEFAQDASLMVRNGGSFQANGTAGAPVVMRGGENVAGYWQGIQFNTVAAANALTHTSIRNAGSAAWFGGPNSTGSLHITGNGSVTLQNVQFSQSGGYAVIRSTGGTLSCAAVDHGGFMIFDFSAGGNGAALAACP